MKEPKLLKKIKNIDLKKQKIILVIVILFVLVLFIGTSYSLLKKNDETAEVVTFQTGELKMKVTSDSALNLKGELPKSDTEGFQNQEVKITLENTGTIEIGKYEVKLLDETNARVLDEKYIRYSISEDDNKRYLKSDILTTNNNIIYTGYNLKDGESKIIYLKVWLDEEAGEAILSKDYTGKIKVELYQRGTRDENLVNVVKSKLVSNYSGIKEDFPGGLVAVNTNGDLYNETKSEEIREYRYSGPSVNNYVKFNNELWRIIGVFKEGTEEFVKIMRNNFIEAEYLPEEYKINDVTYKIKLSNTAIAPNFITGNNDKYDWNHAGLQYYLNTKNDVNGTKGYLSFISDEDYNKIRETTYYLGNVVTPNFKSEHTTTIGYYNDERKNIVCPSEVETNSVDSNCYVWAGNQASWSGKIALPYASDYGYSVNQQYWNSVQLGFGGYDQSGIGENSWIYRMFKSAPYSGLNAVYFLSPGSSDMYRVASFVNTGRVSAGETNNVNRDTMAIPALYLKSNVKITRGDGTSTNPFLLGL